MADSSNSKHKTGFFDLPYDVRRIIYESIFHGRCYVILKTTDQDGNQETFPCSSHDLDEGCFLRVPSIPQFQLPDMRLLLTCKAFYAEAGSVAKKLWLKTYKDSVSQAELLAIADLVRTPRVESLGRLSRVRLLKEAGLDFTKEEMAKSGTCVEIVLPSQYSMARMVMTGDSLLFKTHSPVVKWAAESIDELDYLFYQGVLRTVRQPQKLKTCDVVELDHFGTNTTSGRWLTQDRWHASDPLFVNKDNRLRASIEWEGEDEALECVRVSPSVVET